jgi:PD-(D/E)XK nuclease superfamily
LRTSNASPERNDFASGLNIFEAAGIHRQEIRHSNFLAFLLNPQESHGLGDAFLKRLLQKALDCSSVEPPAISALTLALADFSDALVSREWRNIDVLVESRHNTFVFVIENKIESTESERQLSKYEGIVNSKFPDHRRVFAYLTKDGEPPSDQLWSSINYSDVVDALQEARSNQTNLTNETAMVIDHYIALIRRNIVPEASSPWTQFA